MLELCPDSTPHGRFSFAATALMIAWLAIAGADPTLAEASRKGHLRLQDDSPHRLVVKFEPGAGARLDRFDGLRVRHGAEAERATLDRLTRRHALRFEPLIPLPVERLDALEARARQRLERLGKRANASAYGLSGLFVVDSNASNNDQLLAIGRALEALDSVQYCDLVSTAAPRLPQVTSPTPDFTPSQVYAGPDPGIDIHAAWRRGITGQGVAVTDIEGDWSLIHEDLDDQPTLRVPGWTSTATTPGFVEHGTAVLGILAAEDNGFGVTGLVHGVDQIRVIPAHSVEHGVNPAAALVAAADVSAPGDVIVVEYQTPKGAPAEVEQAVWDATRIATDAGAVVVAAAGNGANDLDSADFAAYRARGDSGAIVVGAGSSDRRHDALAFSTFGSRVDLQGWGENVMTLAFDPVGTEEGHVKVRVDGERTRAYWYAFNGTSSATPIVTAAVIAVQSHLKQRHGLFLDADGLKNLLIATGIPQGTGGHIGPLPNVARALDQVDLWFDRDGVAADFTVEARHARTGESLTFTDRSLRADEAIVTWQWSFPGGDPASFSGATPPPVRYADAGSFDVTLTTTNAAGNVDTERKTDYVTITPELVMHTGAVETCEAVFVDPNPNGDYDEWESPVLTVRPSQPGHRLVLDFERFDTSGYYTTRSGCRYSHLELFDGEDPERPARLDRLCVPGSVDRWLAPEGVDALTLAFTSTNIQTGEGWRAALSCTDADVPVPACDTDSRDTADGWIAEVHLGPKFSSYSGRTGYRDYRQRVAVIQREHLIGERSLGLRLVTGEAPAGSEPQFWRVWLDTDHDGDFASDELLYDSGRAWQGQIPEDILVDLPEEAEGVMLMRVAMSPDGPPEACGEREAGETEDYLVDLTPLDTVCEAGSEDASEEWIAQVAIGGWAHASGSARYSDFTDQVVELTPGQIYPVALAAGYGGTQAWDEYFRIWIDLDDDATFDDPGELVFDGGAPRPFGTSGFLTAPAAGRGEVRMRVAMRWNVAPQACGLFPYGEVEDYTVRFPDDAGPCAGCTTTSGQLTGSGDFDDHPDGTYYWSSGGWQEAWLTGPATSDFDLYLYRWSGVAWQIVARGDGPTSEEEIAYAGSAGYYLWRVRSFQGAGSYSLTLRSPGL